MIAKSIKRSDPETLSILWDDGHESTISLQTLRDHCPCAGCKGETVLLKTYTPSPQPSLPGKYDLASAEQVGYYALQLFWGDGHSTGMYTWAGLRALCECPACTGQRSPAAV